MAFETDSRIWIVKSIVLGIQRPKQWAIWYVPPMTSRSEQYKSKFSDLVSHSLSSIPRPELVYLTRSPFNAEKSGYPHPPFNFSEWYFWTFFLNSGKGCKCPDLSEVIEYYLQANVDSCASRIILRNIDLSGGHIMNEILS